VGFHESESGISSGISCEVLEISDEEIFFLWIGDDDSEEAAVWAEGEAEWELIEAEGFSDRFSGACIND
jgi:hypothetical protein